MRVLVFDTETTGLPKTKLMTKEVLPLWPYIVQFSYLIYDTSENAIVKIRDSIVKIPPTIEISKECTGIHGITNDHCSSQGIPLNELLHDFSFDFQKVDLVVAHNLSFDLNMVKVELMRIIQSFQGSITRERSLFITLLKMLQESNKYYCTMKESIDLCNIKAISKKGNKEFVKFPKLVELHEKLFYSTPKNLHNSLNDVLVCLRCYYGLIFKKDLLILNDEFKYLFEEYLM
jgi:DNA polymerase III epsilon subunit-like protein